MNSITIRFYAELNDLIPPERRQVTFSHGFNGQTSVKDLIESLGVPHPEVDLILVDGESVGFSKRLEGGETVAVYPLFRTLDISVISQVRPQPLSEYRFVLDSHLGRLAAYLRMVGFDAVYRNVISDPELADISDLENRVLLTCDRGLLKRTKVVYGYCVRSQDPTRQLAEVLRRFDLFPHLRPFRRCMSCNGVLELVPKEQVLDRLPAKVADFYDEFHLCPRCGRIYWKGTHYRRMNEFIRQVKDENQCEIPART